MSGPGPIPRAGLSCLGLGFAPFAPGTVGSAGCAVLLAACGGPLWAIAASVLVGSLVTLLWADSVSDGEGHGDPGWVVSDEWAGQALAGVALPFFGAGGSWVCWLVAFVVFRLLDITKPGPVGVLERVPGAWGVLLDDLAAGAGAAIAAGAVAALHLG